MEEHRDPTEEMLAILGKRVWLPEGLGKDRGDTHEMLKQQVANVAEELDYPVEFEWPLDYKDRSGRIDVVFFRRPHRSFRDLPSHAFEIDYSPKRKSILKLQSLLEPCQKWIIVFNPKPKPGRLRDTVHSGINVYCVRRVHHPYEPITPL